MSLARGGRLALLSLVACGIATAGPDEARLMRAPGPSAGRPLLLLVLDGDAVHQTPARPAPAYDPAQDYGALLPRQLRCEPARIYWRRGPGPTPDCHQQQGISPGNDGEARGFQCESARAGLQRHGFHVAARAAQWQSRSGGYWAGLGDGEFGAVECRADRGRHGSGAGGRYATRVGPGPWADSPADEIAWDAPPLSAPHVFYSGNFLNYLALQDQAGSARGIADELPAALAASDGLDVALLAWPQRAGSPAAEFLRLVPQPAETATPGAALADWPRIPARGDPGALGAITAWAAEDPSVFRLACRAVTAALVDDTTGAGARALAGESGDLHPGLPALQWLQPLHVPAFAPPHRMSAANLVAAALMHDAAIAAPGQSSAAGMMQLPSGRHAGSVWLGLSIPRTAERWLGELRRYALAPPEDGTSPARLLEIPQARARFPEPGSRRMFSDLAPAPLTSPDNELLPGNPYLDAALLGLGRYDPEPVEELLLQLRSRQSPGDPGLWPPVAIDYGSGRSALVLIATHDGILHAFDAESGLERWAFLPRPLLARLPVLARDLPAPLRSHGISGRLVLHRHETRLDGVIDRAAGEHLWLFFGLGQGGSVYYALDLADPDAPLLMWSRDPDAPERGLQSLAEPVVARLDLRNPAQNPGRWVVLLTGGYDPRLDEPGSATGTAGSSLAIHDAQGGQRLWRAARTDADLTVAALDASLASAPRVLDADGDGWLDRAYLVDAGGQLWRFDFRNAVATGDTATATRIAQLGNGLQRFLSSPDLALLGPAAEPRLALTLGSGWLTRPRDASLADQVYSVRDRWLGAPVSGVLEQQLHLVEDDGPVMPAQTPGWRWPLTQRGPGEKLAVSPVTAAHRVHLLSYRPLPMAANGPCGPPLARHNHYLLDLATGQPANRLRWPPGDEEGTPATGLPAGLRFAFPGPDHCSDCARVILLRGEAALEAGIDGGPWRTSWRPRPRVP